MVSTGELNSIGNDFELQPDTLKILADSYNFPVMFFVKNELMTSPALSYMNPAAVSLFEGMEKIGEGIDITILASKLFGESNAADILSNFFEKGEFRGRVQLRLQENDQAEIVLKRLDSRKAGSIAFMVIDRRGIDEEILRSYPAMLQRFELSYNMTKHDIQNHIAAISSYLELCFRDESTEVRNQYLARISAIVQDMTKYIRNMGAATPSSVKVEWRRIDDIVRSGLSDIAMEGVKVSIDCNDFEMPYTPLLSRVFYNLAYNSLCHGKHVRAISVHCEHEGDTLRVIYRDDGPGISPSVRPRLFAPPAKGGKLHALFLIRQILFLHGCTISEKGQFGSGARFEISIPESQFRKDRGKSGSTTP